MNEQDFIKLKCNKCINNNTELCEIRENIAGEYQCLYYNKEENK